MNPETKIEQKVEHDRLFWGCRGGRCVMPEQTAAQAASEFFGCGCDCGCPQHNRPGPKPRGGKR